MALMPRVALAVLVACLAAGAEANIITGTKFPFEGCKQGTTTGLYSAVLKSYQLTPYGSNVCFKIQVQPQATCYRAANYPRNTTRCCDVGFNKFKFYPNQACRTAVKGATLQLASDTAARSISISYQNMPNYNNQFVMKLTNLGLTQITAQNAIICIQLQGPCPTMRSWAYNPNVLEFNLYDARMNYAYECCPAGTVNVVNQPFIS